VFVPCLGICGCITVERTSFPFLLRPCVPGGLLAVLLLPLSVQQLRLARLQDVGPCIGICFERVFCVRPAALLRVIGG